MKIFISNYFFEDYYFMFIHLPAANTRTIAPSDAHITYDAIHFITKTSTKQTIIAAINPKTIPHHEFSKSDRTVVPN